jgi:hypothetical protein
LSWDDTIDPVWSVRYLFRGRERVGMIVELVEGERRVGTFQSPSVPRQGETVRYDDTTYVIEDVAWTIESTHHQNVETVELFVERVE